MGKPDPISEGFVINAVIGYFSSSGIGSATTTEIREWVIDGINTGRLQWSETRPNEFKTAQIVRNVVCHRQGNRFLDYFDYDKASATWSYKG